MVACYPRFVAEAAADEITATENALRELIQSALAPALGKDWIEQSGLTPERLTKVRERLGEERRRRGAVVEQDLIYFSDLPDLGVIIRKHWDSFHAALGERKLFDCDMKRLEDARLTIMHGRELLQHEVSFVDAISREIRNKVTVARTMTGPGGREYFPRFEQVTDSLGNTPKGDGFKFVQTGVVLRPGDTVEFKCRGWDPDGKPFELKWRVMPPGRHELTFEDSLVWEVAAENISEDTRVQVTLVSSRSYHRSMSGWDDMVEFAYVVLPRGDA